MPPAAGAATALAADATIPAKVTEVLGDGRLSLERDAPQNFDLLFMDAFSGDSVPVHLITREAFRNQGRLTDLIESGKLFSDIGMPALNPENDRVLTFSY